MPTGYTYKALIGAVYNDGSLNFLRFIQRGTRVFYVARQQVLNAGNQTASTAVSVSGFVPVLISRAYTVSLRYNAPGAVAIATIEITPGITFETLAGDASFAEHTTLCLPANTSFNYFVGNSGNNLNAWVHSFELFS